MCKAVVSIPLDTGVVNVVVKGVVSGVVKGVVSGCLTVLDYTVYRGGISKQCIGWQDVLRAIELVSQF